MLRFTYRQCSHRGLCSHRTRRVCSVLTSCNYKQRKKNNHQFQVKASHFTTFSIFDILTLGSARHFIYYLPRFNKMQRTAETDLFEDDVRKLQRANNGLKCKFPKYYSRQENHQRLFYVSEVNEYSMCRSTNYDTKYRRLIAVKWTQGNKVNGILDC